MLIAIDPKRKPRLTISMPPPTVEEGENLLVISFDGSARVKRKSGAYSAIVWKLLEWNIVAAASEYAMDLTVNGAEYSGLLLGFDLLDKQTRGRIIICGNSNWCSARCRVRSVVRRRGYSCYDTRRCKGSSRVQSTSSYT